MLKLASNVRDGLADGSFLDDFDPAVARGPYSPGLVFRRMNQYVAFVNKYPYDDKQLPGFDPDAAAIDAFKKAERRNRRLNSIFRAHGARGTFRHPLHAAIKDVVWRVLRDEPDFNSIYSKCDFSSGASVGVRGNATHVGRKLGERLSITPSCVWHFRRALRFNDHLRDFVIAREGEKIYPAITSPVTKDKLADVALDHWIEPVQHNIICCAPKNSLISRTISLEATGNTYIQKGFDNEMRDLLLSELNLDLTVQSENGLMAFEGSLPCSLDPYVTLDVKDASTSVITELVKYYSPPAWFTALNEVRSPMGMLPDGTFHRYQVFSTMGNGFTFPLETLIFAACAVAVYRHCGLPCDFRVYGDDIIVRQSVALLMIEVLRSNGFQLNLTKSFVHGPFRESCGANWYEGLDVTPAYWRNHVTDRPALQAIHNAHKECPEVQDTLRLFDAELPYVVPEIPMYGWVTDQAFRVPMDLCMSNKHVVWRRDTQSWRFPLLIATGVSDETFGISLRGNPYKAARWYSVLRGAIPRQPFPFRRSQRFLPVRPGPDSKLECCKAPQFGRVSPLWSADEICTHKLLVRGGHRQPLSVMKGWGSSLVGLERG